MAILSPVFFLLSISDNFHSKVFGIIFGSTVGTTTTGKGAGTCCFTTTGGAGVASGAGDCIESGVGCGSDVASDPVVGGWKALEMSGAEPVGGGAEQQ